MKNISIKSPSLQELFEAAEIILQEFNPKKLVFLDKKGNWKDSPSSIEERTLNELIYAMWKDKLQKDELIREIYASLVAQKKWNSVILIKLGLLGSNLFQRKTFNEEEVETCILSTYDEKRVEKGLSPFCIIIEVLAWLISLEALRQNAEGIVPLWDKMGSLFKEEARKKLEDAHSLFEIFPEKEEINKFIFLFSFELSSGSYPALFSLVKLISEEEKLTWTIDHLLKISKMNERREECLSLILERIQPPMGIVTLTSRALLRPCLRLLTDSTIEVSSGIQYTAATVLSIIKDPRSTETLKLALRLFTSAHSEIRRNLIYTLGNLKDKEALEEIVRVLEEAEEKEFKNESSGMIPRGLIEEKIEAIWAMGKIGFDSIAFLPPLLKHVEHPSPKIRAYLAWSLGELGAAQKKKLGGLSAEIMIALLKLLKDRDKEVFEEAVSAMRKIDLPEFTHSLYLYHLGAVNILGLKPSQKGLYELSETIHYLIENKKRAIIAVNGDSGTGKTYFCQSIIKGFGKVRESEILYLMRDRRKDQKIFNRILGLKWLKKYIDPVYYQEYLFSEEEDDPEGYFQKFLKENEDKKLIILDGCRDQHYFQRVVDIFYFKGELDVVVNFRATISTRRLNLEEREVSLESVNTHLAFLEEPALEDTLLYREGKIILYDLDNSISRRLNSQEIRELFEERRIDSWGELIRLGEFKGKESVLRVESEKFMVKEKRFILEEDFFEYDSTPFTHQERKFEVVLNLDSNANPNLLARIEANDLKPKKIRFYAQEQVAGFGEGGSIFVLTFLDSRVFYTTWERCLDMALLGRDIFLLSEEGELLCVSFEKDELIKMRKDAPKSIALGAYLDRCIISAHEDGSLRIWDFRNNCLRLIKSSEKPALCFAFDYWGNIYSAHSDGTIAKWDLVRKVVTKFRILEGEIIFLNFFRDGRILVLCEKEKRSGFSGKLHIFDLNNRSHEEVSLPFNKKISSVSTCNDGRIIISLLSVPESVGEDDEKIVEFSLFQKECRSKSIKLKELEIFDFLIMGPKLIACGSQRGKGNIFFLLGTEDYVRREAKRLFLTKK